MDITSQNAFIHKKHKMKKTHLLEGPQLYLKMLGKSSLSMEKSCFPHYWYKPVFGSYWLGSCRARGKNALNSMYTNLCNNPLEVEL